MEADRLKDTLDDLLITSAAERYAVLGVRKRSHDAANVLKLPQVTTSILSGDFPKLGGSPGGPFQHDVTFRIDLLVAAICRANLAVLNDPDAMPEALAAALSAATSADANADTLFDATASLLWDIIMRPENRTLGFDYDPSRWVTSIAKNEFSRKGAIVLLSGSINMTATVIEYPSSETGVTGYAIDSTIPLSGDTENGSLDLARQGVKEGE